MSATTMKARGFCTCGRDFPGRYPLPAGATWHYVCDKPVLPVVPPLADLGVLVPTGRNGATGTGWV
jgi:hypothetical protein